MPPARNLVTSYWALVDRIAGEKVRPGGNPATPCGSAASDPCDSDTCAVQRKVVLDRQSTTMRLQSSWTASACMISSLFEGQQPLQFIAAPAVQQLNKSIPFKL